MAALLSNAMADSLLIEAEGFDASPDGVQTIQTKQNSRVPEHTRRIDQQSREVNPSRSCVWCAPESGPAAA